MAKRSKSRKVQSNQSNKPPLWQWGTLLIIAGVVANLATGMLLKPGNSMEAQGQAFGRGLVTVVAVIAGISMIVIHFVRRNRR